VKGWRENVSGFKRVAHGVEEFITGELPGKALFRVPGIKVTTLHAAAVSK
jgi:hypothetical protein